MAVDCQFVEHEKMIDKYLAGKLSEAEEEAFEQHCLGCQRCFDELRFHHATAIELKTQRAALPRTVVTPKAAWRTWAMAAAAILLVTLAVPFFYKNQRNVEVVHDQPSRPSQPDDRQVLIARLASVEAPPYISLTLRGGSRSAATEQFQKGMELYGRRDFAGASGLLDQAVALKPDLQPALFYLGISELMADQPDKAIATFSRLTRIEDTSYAEDSHWFLAKAFLKKQDLASARKQLELVLTLNGSHLAEARKSLEVIREITGQ